MARTLKFISRYCTFSKCFPERFVFLFVTHCVCGCAWLCEKREKKPECLRKSKETLNSLEGVFL